MTNPTQEVINTGNTSNDGTGDTIRVSFVKTNNNFAELYSATNNATANLVSLDTKVETYNGNMLSLGSSAFTAANNGYNLANTANTVSIAASTRSNNAANTANGAAVNAAAAFAYANSLVNASANAHAKANQAYVIANAAFAKANTVDITDQNLADLSVIVLEHVFPRSNDAYDLSLQVYSYSQGVAVNAAAAFNASNNQYGYLNSASYKLNSAYVVVNAAYTSLNAAYVVANSGYTVANGAFRVTNAAFGVANAALPNVSNAVFNGHLYTSNTLHGGSYDLSSNGVWGSSNNWYGGYFRSSNNHSLKAESTGNNDAIFTLAQRGNGVFGTANTGNGVVGFSDTGYGGYFYSANGVPLGSGYLKQADDGTLQIVDAIKVTSNGMLQFDSGFGYTANAYGVRAWVNFDGTSSVSSLANLSFTANGTTKVIKVTISGLANNTPEYNDIVVDSTVVLVGTGNGTRTRHTDGATYTFASYLAIGNRQSGVGRAYKVTATGNNWFEAYYDSPGYGYWSVWFFWWWWWYYVYGWYVPTGYKFTGTCSVMRSKIRGSGGVSSVNDLGEGKYQINFDFEMPDTNYCVTGTASSGDYFNYDWRSSSYLGVRTMHTSFVEVSSNHGWGGGGYWWWFWWIPTWTGPGTYPAKQMHVAVIR